MQFGIVGYGTVGRATASVFPPSAVYDPPKGLSDASTLASCDTIFLCLPTPTTSSGDCDLSFMHMALEAITPHLGPDHVLAVRSTVLPGTVRQLRERYGDIHFASNPEFIRAHLAEEDARQPSRVVIGADSDVARERLAAAYRERHGDGIPIVVTDAITAEFIKYAANCFLATKITYAREVREAAEMLSVRYEHVVTALSLDQRIGGGDEWWLAGVDDECLPKDLDAFVTALHGWGLRPQLLETVVALRDPGLETNFVPSPM